MPGLQIMIRRWALLALFIFIGVALTAQFTVIVNADHKCIGDGCPICKLIQNAETLLKQIGKTVISISVLLMALFIMTAVMMTGHLICNNLSTLVNKKIQLNN